MKLSLILLAAFALNGALYASESNPCSSNETIAAAPEGARLTLEDISSVNEAVARPFRSYWHCTAYAEGHGQPLGYDYRDVHYNHAYWGAVNRCERATGHHCHDVHCHVDRH